MAKKKKKQVIRERAAIDRAIAAAGVTPALLARTPKHNVGDTVTAAKDIVFSDLLVPAGTPGVVMDVFEFGDEIYYSVRFAGDVNDRMVGEDQIR